MLGFAALSPMGAGMTGMRGFCARALGWVMLAGTVLPGLAWANEPVEYPRDYFDPFAPQTAEDMVERVPGFTIRGGEGGERGFGQASLNILINGRRPSSKSADAEDILGRISADTVLKVEVLDGTTLDIPGLTGDVVNVVTKAVDLSGNWRYAGRFEEGTEPQLLEGEVTLNGESGDVAWTVTGRSGQFTFTEDGDEQFFNGADQLIEDRFEDIVFERVSPSVDVALSWSPPSGHIANLNGRVELGNENLVFREFSERVSDGGFDGQSLFTRGEDELEYELGADYQIPVGKDTLKLIGLFNGEDSEFVNVSQAFFDGFDPFTSVFAQDIDERETIARVEYTVSGGAWQAAVEGAYNTLEADSVLDGTDLGLTRVEERRAEGTLTHSRKLGRFDVQASVGAEYSELSVPTSPSPAREFVRPKGFLSASTDLSPKLSTTFLVERKVGQLNFFDFVDRIDLNEGRDNAGNDDIKPDQTWRAEAALERTDPKGLSGRISAAYALIEDPIDRVLFADGTEGPGNLESNAAFYELKGNFTYVMDGIGLKGFRWDASGQIIETELEDPLTGETRRFNGVGLWNYDTTLRHDVPNTPYAWFVRLRQTAASERFRFDEALDFRFDRPTLRIGAEHKDVFGMNLQVNLDNVLDEGRDRNRFIFDGDRFGDLLRIERFERRRGPRFSIVLSDTF